MKRRRWWRRARLVAVLVLVAGGGGGLTACAAGPGGERERRVAELERQLRERDAEIAELRRQLGGPAAAPTAEEAPAAAAPGREPPAPITAPTAGAAVARPVEGEEETARALERALVRQGGSVIPLGAIDTEPEVSYFYNEPSGGGRRDTFIAALTLRAGLPWQAQADLRVPYVLHDRQTGLGSSSGLGDIELGLTKQLVAERDYVPELLLRGGWKTASGRSGGALPTGTGTDSVQAALTAVKRQDPIVLFGTLSYTKDLGSSRLDLGDTAGGAVGVFLAATPDTSVFLDISANSIFASRIEGRRLDETDRLSAVLELGLTTILGRDTALNATAGIGVTPAAPDFRLTLSLPTRF